MGRPSLREEARSTEHCVDATDEAPEGTRDSFTDDNEAFESPLADKVLSVDSKEDMEDDTEEVCWVEVSWEEVQEGDVARWPEAAASFWSLPFEWWDCWEEAAGGDVVAAGDTLASVVGEDGGEERRVCPFFSEEWEDKDSRLPIGVVSGLLLNVSPAKGNGKLRSGDLKAHLTAKQQTSWIDGRK